MLDTFQSTFSQEYETSVRRHICSTKYEKKKRELLGKRQNYHFPVYSFCDSLETSQNQLENKLVFEKAMTIIHGVAMST